MKRIVPSIGTPVQVKDILNGFCSMNAMDKFKEVLRKQCNRKYVLLTNSGTTAYFIILKALKKISDRKEVILPAYTAPSLILPIKKAGLIPRLCDINLHTFNMDFNALNKVVGDNTLAVTLIHMFGLPTWFEGSSPSHPSNDKSLYEGTCLIEDLASSLGSDIKGNQVGSFGDVSFVSFNRGKNLSTLAGGAILTDREDIYNMLVDEGEEYLQGPSFTLKMEIIFKSIALSFAVKPWFYSLLRSIISRYKYTELHHDFDSYGYTKFQAGLGLSLFQKAQKIYKKRYENGLSLYRRLSHAEGITLPDMPADSKPVFNQFPLLIEDDSKRDIIHGALTEEGVEATTLYPDPIHRAYNDLGYDLKNDPFPNATYLSKRLLLVPTHPYVVEDDLKRTTDIVLRHI